MTDITVLTIDQLPTASHVATTDLIPLLQGGVTKAANFGILSQSSNLLPMGSYVAGTDIISVVQGDNVARQVTANAIGSAIVTTLPLVIQSGTGAVAETVQGFLQRLAISATSFMTDAQRADVAAGTALLDVSSAVQAAINRANVLGCILYFPPGIYLIGTTTLIFKNNVTYKGSGKGSLTLGTVIKYTGTSDAIQINNPINSSTGANISVEDISISCTVRTAGKAAFADVGSSFLSFKRVFFRGNDHGLILDQSEIVLVDECDFELSAVNSTDGLWLVNGADHTVGGTSQFTNRITVKGCQFNGTVGIGIVDDGGISHHFYDNNFNSLAKHIRVAQVNGLVIDGANEHENPTTTCIHFAATKISGAAVAGTTSVSMRDNYFVSSDAISLITYDVGAVLNQVLDANTFINNNVGGSPTTGLSNVARHSGAANNQQGTGTATNAALGNYKTGTATNDDAPTGAIGEIVTATLAGASKTALVSNTAKNVTSISLTAGDWDVSGIIAYSFGVTTSYTILQGSTSTTSATMGAVETQYTFETPAAVPSGTLDMRWVVPTTRLSLNATTTVYLVALGLFTVSTLSVYGTIRARRVR